MKEYLIPILTGVIFLIIGVACLVWPEKIQEYGLKQSAHGLGKYNPFLNWMETRNYLLTLRIIGVMVIIVFLLLVYLLVFDLERVNGVGSSSLISRIRIG
jgi:hypothetical protein